MPNSRVILPVNEYLYSLSLSSFICTNVVPTSVKMLTFCTVMIMFLAGVGFMVDLGGVVVVVPVVRGVLVVVVVVVVVVVLSEK